MKTIEDMNRLIGTLPVPLPEGPYMEATPPPVPQQEAQLPSWMSGAHQFAMQQFLKAFAERQREPQVPSWRMPHPMQATAGERQVLGMMPIAGDVEDVRYLMEGVHEGDPAKAAMGGAAAMMPFMPASLLHTTMKAAKSLLPPKIVYHGSPDKIEKPTFGDDIGIHFGTEKAAQERLNVTNQGEGFVQPFAVDIRNPIEAIHDPGTWDNPNDALNALPFSEQQRDIALDRMDAAGQSPINKLDALAEYLGELGYDGITYGNAFEGDQSWIVFDESQITRR